MKRNKFIQENKTEEQRLRERNYHKKYQEENKEYIKKQGLEFRELNREYIKKQRMGYKKKKLESNINYYLKDRLSTRMRMAIMNHKGIKQSSAIVLLGANIETVRKHIESKFVNGMSWGNHGEWHIDHIIPCAKFDLTKEEEQLKCFHYTNLQPLWAMDNIMKKDKHGCEEY